MRATKVGIREFRSGLADFIASATPVAITRHGQTVAYLIPASPQPEAAEAEGAGETGLEQSVRLAMKTGTKPARKAASKRRARPIKQIREHG